MVQGIWGQDPIRTRTMLVEGAHYLRGIRQHEASLSLHEAAGCPRSGGSFVWLEVQDPEQELMRELGERFGLHELAVEDAGREHQRPKVEAYDDFFLIVFRTARYDTATRRVEIGELDLFVGAGYVIAVRHGAAGDLRAVRRRLEERHELLRSGPAAVVWGILDDVVDAYGPVVEGLEADIEDVERQIFTGAQDATERIYLLKQEVGEVLRAVHPLLEPLGGASRGIFSGMDPRMRRYFRDVHDHLVRVEEEVVAQREQLVSALDANVSLLGVRQSEIAVRQSEVAKQLTIVATVFLPLTFVTGFFGQNFGWLEDHVGSLAAFLVLGVGLCTVVAIALVLWFRRGRYA